MTDNEGLNGSNEANNPEAEKWQNMDVRGQAKGESSQDVPTEASETEPASSEDNAKADTEDSMPLETNTEDDTSLNNDHASTSSDESPEKNKQGQYEQGLSGRRLEAYEERNNHEPSRAEKRLESYEKRLDEIEQELIKASTDKAELEVTLDGLDGLLEENFKQHETLSTKADQLKLEAKQMKRRIISRVFMIPKAIVGAMTNNDDAFFSLFADENPFKAISDDAKKGQEASQSLKDTQNELSANESENQELKNSRDDTADQIKAIDDKTARLNAEKARLEKESKELKEIAYNEGFEEAIADATDGKGVKRAIRAEGRNILGHERNIDRLEEEKAAINSRYDKEIEDANAAIQEAMKAYESLINMPGEDKRDAEQLSEQMNDLQKQAQAQAEQTRVKRLDIKDVGIGEEREAIGTSIRKIELIKGLEKSEGIKGSLARLKKKIIDRLRGF